MSQNGVVASVYVLGRTEAVDELFDFDFFEPDYTEVGDCHQDCLKMLKDRLGRYRDVKDLPFSDTEGDHDDDCPFVLKGRVVAHPKVKGAFLCEYIKQYVCLGQVQRELRCTSAPQGVASRCPTRAKTAPAAEGTPAAKRQRTK